jgi:hypothetical protein
VKRDDAERAALAVATRRAGKLRAGGHAAAEADRLALAHVSASYGSSLTKAARRRIRRTLRDRRPVLS